MCIISRGGADEAVRHRIEWAQLVAVAAVTSMGCRAVLGVDDYRSGPGATDVLADSAAPLPILPALPDPDRIVACEPCVKEKCGDYRRTCLSSPRCRAMLACQSPCDDPACIAECQARLPRSYAFEAYFGCAFGSLGLVQPTVSSCPAECGAGQNWKCSGRYKWPTLPGNLSFSVSVHLLHGDLGGFGPLSYVDQVEVAPCTDVFVGSAPAFDFGCDQAGWVPVADYGNLRIPLASVFGIRSTPDGLSERHRYYPGPPVPGRPIDLIVNSLQPNSALLISARAAGGFDPGLGVVATALWDCLGELANSEVDLVPPGSAHRYYPGSAVPSDQPGMASAFFNVLPGPAVHVKAIPTGDPPPPASERTVIVGPGAVTSVYLYPAE